ncbi:DNA-directed RNA polymerase III subunit RPC4 isoform X2 [Chelonus insularis]|nr:DNA-directed RNA polymerase III subunit RPC4-like isoform X2 [Chelonus insularis]XP_034941055.1 DNA-directed RNA polymerase III subunit RPC4-like isoform X2 [Chelonus insularis]XP_034941056.1 DNA-directed RNA polymerase III subunit RPC4-like isoform X2 [Chelonus insularis]XP_034941057.1 DNA-directed RNA polymerase III subunit RPC4-like isoform X2 [Chelonus insularis]
MASKKPSNVNATSSNSKLNSEPSTSTLPVTKIKTEHGSPISVTRLPSFRVPRDLTLGSNIKLEKVTKKIYTPNINVQRNKKTEDTSAPKNDSNDNRNRPRARGRGGPNDRGRGRGKPSNLIQSSGVFSEGLADSMGRPGRSSGGYRSSSDDREAKPVLEKPKLNLNYTVDKAEEEKKLKLLLRDDFVEHESEINTDYSPISLPLTEEGELLKSEIKNDEKLEPSDEEKEEVDQKPIILENGEVAPPPRLKKIKKPVPLLTPKVENKPTTVPQIIDNQSNGYLMLRFPDCLPGFRSYDETSDPRSKDKNNEQSKEQNKTEEKTEYCTLNDLKAGFLGKIQIHRSGKAKLILGENSLVIDVGSQLCFRQDVVAAKIDGVNNELVNLGPITSTLICTPDFESMLDKL